MEKVDRQRRLAIGDKVKVTDEASPHFGETGTLIQPKPEPVRMKLEYHWWVKLDGTGKTELFAPEQLETLTD
jgi:hypothetical protein